MIGIMLALIAAATPHAGIYRSHQAEIDAALELQTDGRFRYQLDYGAVSETGQGRLEAVGPDILLTSQPMPKPPAYTLVSDKPLPLGKMTVEVHDKSPYFNLVDVAYQIDGKDGEVVQVGKGEVIELPIGSTVKVLPLIPVYGEPGAELTLKLDRGHALQFRFEPNQIGVARFDKTPLAIEDGDLLLKRYDMTIRLKRAKP